MPRRLGLVKVETRGAGVRLPELKLALDTHAPGFTSLVSHAHGDHIPWDATHAWSSAETADIMARRKPDLDVSILPWDEPTRVNGALVTIHPAGHILGSAMLRIEAPSGESLLYTGDTKLAPARTTRSAQYPEADLLVVESTFGLPVFRWPPRDAVERQMVDFARETLAAGETPVFLGYALGKAQEILGVLDAAGVPTAQHGAVWGLSEIYAAHGTSFERSRAYAPGSVGSAALVVPPTFRAHPMVTRLKARIAYCSGWALLSKSRAQMDADALVALSDHADFTDLLEIVRRVRPKRVLPNHGYADVFAHLLRKEGLDAQPLAVGHTEEDAAPGGDAAQRTIDPHEGREEDRG